MILNAIKDTGQFFGAAHITDVVRGAETAKIKERKHDQLNSFNSMSSYPKTFVSSLIRLLVAFGALRINFERYGAITLTEIADEILSEYQTFRSKKDCAGSKKNIVSKSSVQRESEKSKTKTLLQNVEKSTHGFGKRKKCSAFVIFQIERDARWLMLSRQVDKTFLTLVVLVKNWMSIYSLLQTILSYLATSETINLIDLAKVKKKVIFKKKVLPIVFLLITFFCFFWFYQNFANR